MFVHRTTKLPVRSTCVGSYLYTFSISKQSRPWVSNVCKSVKRRRYELKGQNAFHSSIRDSHRKCTKYETCPNISQKHIYFTKLYAFNTHVNTQFQSTIEIYAVIRPLMCITYVYTYLQRTLV